MKNMKKIIAILLSVSAMTMSAVAFADATYNADTNTAALADTITGASEGDQLTVVIVPKNEVPTSDNIYYINQGAFGDEFSAILAEMKLKAGDAFSTTTYEVRIGGTKADGEYTVQTFAFEGGSVLYGDANADGEVLANDATRIIQYRAGADVEIDLVASDANDDGEVLANDATRIIQYRAGADVTLGPVA